jgi:hypothetical protein
VIGVVLVMVGLLVNQWGGMRKVAPA